MWSPGYHINKTPHSYNKELAEITGELTTEEAQIAFAKFCRANPNFTINLLIGMELFPYQELAIRTMFLKDYFLGIWTRGGAKSFAAAWFIILYCLLYPGSRIGICSSNARQAKEIFQKIEDWATGPKGGYLLQCIQKGKNGFNKRPEAWTVKIGQSFVAALPLGPGIRGYRFNVIVIDELLLLTEKEVNEIIKPFMVALTDPIEREKVKKAEDKLILAGKMTEADRIQFQTNKLIGLSSASYKFEFLYKLFESYKDLIFDDKANDVSHAIMQFSYEMIPEAMFSKQVIEDAKRTYSTAQLGREYCAQFSDDSGGFFSAQKMQEATVDIGEKPTLKIAGESDKEYILGFDPNYNDSESSDDFAICLIELDNKQQKGTVVHNYALAKSTIKSRAIYFNYLFNHFNIVYVIGDHAGGFSFINDLNNLGLLDKKIRELEVDFNNKEKKIGIANTRESYQNGNIFHSQPFNETGWIREANEFLQGHIERKNIRFGSMNKKDSDFATQMALNIPIMGLEYSIESMTIKDEKVKMANFIEYQDEMINLLKKECSLIEITTSASGHQRFDLPANLKRDKSPTRAKKDSYSALLLAVWGMKCYYEMMGAEEVVTGFIPRFIV